ncbi:MAG: hypothetical protein A3F67_07875 [Verrucomicrobia bacterium RIFCSPHIGHO2_12_FULL_41_10]|nr:MAG: hypothetical protein A3F67_07875 [Verrucomicrobia bacterium RIFCSPHIGHO2_12_FULL_41_10]HLB34777.1 hypothetical protein [Chthoniobacterales bacterium]
MKTNHRSLRRKFLLLEKPERFTSLKSIEIEQGTIARYPDRELRVRRIDKKHYLSSREKTNGIIVPQNKELLITSTKFETLWPFTQGERIMRKRYLFTLKKLHMKIDCFLGEHAPLELIEVFFPTLTASKSFEKPDFFGDEVTHRQEYDTSEMALHGIPEPKGIYQIGILPYTFKDRKLHVLLITSSSGNRWILPKGRQEPDMTPHEVAVMEAVEEGGVLGTLRQDLRLRCQMADGRFLQLYAMKISKLLGSWPEENQRLRRLLPVNDALEMIDDKQLAKSIRRLAMQLNK